MLDDAASCAIGDKLWSFLLGNVAVPRGLSGELVGRNPYRCHATSVVVVQPHCNVYDAAGGLDVEGTNTAPAAESQIAGGVHYRHSAVSRLNQKPPPTLTRSIGFPFLAGSPAGAVSLRRS